MWKIAVAFVAFAAIAVYVLTRAGGDVDMGGEKHSVEAAGSAASGAAKH